MELALRDYGSGPPIVLLHGLFGSGSNWGRIARSLAEHYHVLVPDLRNHGRSPHTDDMSLPAMAEDVAALLAQHGVTGCLLAGHSLGGKVAMATALQHPASVRGLAVVDIGPMPTPNRFGGILNALQKVQPETLDQRADADAVLAEVVENPALRAFLLKNLRATGDGWRWALNLPAIAAHIETLMDWPAELAARQYAGPTGFIRGANSPYLRGVDEAALQRQFPRAQLRTVPDAGHWVHYEQPEAFLAVLRDFAGAVHGDEEAPR